MRVIGEGGRRPAHSIKTAAAASAAAIQMNLGPRVTRMDARNSSQWGRRGVNSESAAETRRG